MGRVPPYDPSAGLDAGMPSVTGTRIESGHHRCPLTDSQDSAAASRMGSISAREGSALVSCSPRGAAPTFSGPWVSGLESSARAGRIEGDL
jgi:hypothetical protein